MNRIKALQEQRAAKVKELSELRDAAKEAALNEEQRGKFDGLVSEIEDLTKDAEREMRALQIEQSKSEYTSLGEKEKRQVDSLDWQKLLTSLAEGRKLDGFEAEMIQEGQREAREAGVQHTGFVLPRVALQKRDMTATGGTDLNQGGVTIETNKMGVLDGLYNALTLRQAGAQLITGLRGNFDWPRWVQPANPTHKAENAAADKLEPKIVDVSFTPKRLPAYVLVSDQLIIQSSDVIEAVIRRNLIEQVAARAEYYAINGSGSGQPRGILNTTGIGAVVGGTNGAAPDWADIVALETKVNVQNANRGTMRYLSNNKVRGQLKVTPKATDSGAPVDSMKILDDRNGALLNSYEQLWTGNVPDDLTKGSANGICSAIIFGHFPDLVQAFWSGISLDMIRDSQNAIEGRRTLVMNVYHDANVIRPESFAAMKDALTPDV